MSIPDIGPLDWRIAIADTQGKPTPEFQRRWTILRGFCNTIPSLKFLEIAQSAGNTSYIAATLGTIQDVAFIDLTAGTWDVWGTVIYSSAGTTTTSALNGWIHTVSVTKPTFPNGGASFTDIDTHTITSAAQMVAPIGRKQYTFTTATRIYLSASMAGTGGVGALAGGLYAREII